MIKDNPLIKKLLKLKLPKDDFVIFGSGPMFAHGIKDLGHDIDIVARDKAWEKALELGYHEYLSTGGEVIKIFNGEIEVYNNWVPGSWDINNLIDNAEIIEELRFVPLDVVLKWKLAMGREKDFEHIKMIKDYFKRN